MNKNLKTGVPSCNRPVINLPFRSRLSLSAKQIRCCRQAPASAFGGVEHVPPNLVPKLARKHGVDKQSRNFTPWSHVNSMLFAQLSHALSLNDVCDTLRNHSGSLATMREAQPPSRNGLAHANRTHNADMAEELFRETLNDLQKRTPAFRDGAELYRRSPSVQAHYQCC